MIRVLVVDDSAVVRKILTDDLSRYPDIEVVGTAVDPYVARDRIAQLDPDVLTLDLEMPRMDGLSFLAALMRHHPLPVVVVSSVAPEHSEAAMRALSLGAVEVISKPGSALTAPDVSGGLVQAIRSAAHARPRATVPAAGPPPEMSPTLWSTHRVIAIGASTGGPQALEAVLRSLPADGPGIVIVQHMPEHFTASFAARLNTVCAMEVQEARDGAAVVAGVALVAPGDHHMVVQRSGARYLVRVRGGPPVHHQRPSVDVLFQSVARAAGPNGVGAILTGMGADGAAGLLAMRHAGAYTIAQDQASCVVFGMPREAIRVDAAKKILPLEQIPREIMATVAQEPANVA